MPGALGRRTDYRYARQHRGLEERVSLLIILEAVTELRRRSRWFERHRL